jgi:hypothetical protein
MTHDQLHTFFISKGWDQDRWGNYHGLDPSIRYRIRKLVLRKEKKTSWGEWMRLSSGYIGSLELTPEGKIRGMKL